MWVNNAQKICFPVRPCQIWILRKPSFVERFHFEILVSLVVQDVKVDNWMDCTSTPRELSVCRWWLSWGSWMASRLLTRDTRCRPYGRGTREYPRFSKNVHISCAFRWKSRSILRRRLIRWSWLKGMLFLQWRGLEDLWYPGKGDLFFREGISIL